MEKEKPFFIEGEPLFESEQEKNQRETEEAKSNERSEYEWALDVISGKKKRKTKKVQNKPKGEWGVRNSKLENLTKNTTNQDAKNYLQWLSAKKHNPDLARAMQIISEKALKDYEEQHQQGLQSLEDYDPEQERKENIEKARAEAINHSDDSEQDDDRDMDNDSLESSSIPDPEIIEPPTIPGPNIDLEDFSQKEDDGEAITVARTEVLKAMDDTDVATTNQPAQLNDASINIDPIASTTVPKGTFESGRTSDDEKYDQKIVEENTEVKPEIVLEKKSTDAKKEPEKTSSVFGEIMRTKDIEEIINHLNNESGVSNTGHGALGELKLKEGTKFDFEGKQYTVRKISPETDSVFVGIGEIEEHVVDKKIPKEVKQIDFSTKRFKKMGANELEEMLDYLKNEKGLSGIPGVEKGFGKRLSLKPGLKFYFEGREYNVGKIDHEKGVASVWIGENRIITDAELNKELKDNPTIEKQNKTSEIPPEDQGTTKIVSEEQQTQTPEKTTATTEEIADIIIPEPAAPAPELAPTQIPESTPTESNLKEKTADNKPELERLEDNLHDKHLYTLYEHILAELDSDIYAAVAEKDKNTYNKLLSERDGIQIAFPEMHFDIQKKRLNNFIYEKSKPTRETLASQMGKTILNLENKKNKEFEINKQLQFIVEYVNEKLSLLEQIVDTKYADLAYEFLATEIMNKIGVSTDKDIRASLDAKAMEVIKKIADNAKFGKMVLSLDKLLKKMDRLETSNTEINKTIKPTNTTPENISPKPIEPIDIKQTPESITPPLGKIEPKHIATSKSKLQELMDRGLTKKEAIDQLIDKARKELE